MRRLSRLGQQINILCDSTTPSTITPRSCSACRSHCVPNNLLSCTNFSTLPSRPARRENNADSGKTPFTERLRQKLWGTENPPGQVDPYDKHDRRIRAVDDEVPAATGATESYSPATTWDGLEHVGGFGGWWEKNWDPEHGFKVSMCFIPPERLISPQALTNALHRAVVEVFTLQQAGRPLGDVSCIPNDVSEDITSRVQVTLDEQGVSLLYPDGEVKEEILRSSEAAMGRPEVSAEKSSGEDAEVVESGDPTTMGGKLSAAEEHSLPMEEPAAVKPTEPATGDQLQKIISSWSPTWLSIPLTDPALKFAILKRTTQLTGHLLSDPKIHSLTTTHSFLTHLITPPPPKKLAQTLLENEALVSLPNVKVFERRVTPVDRERTVGRWKAIERELREKGLPVLGRE